MDTEISLKTDESMILCPKKLLRQLSIREKALKEIINEKFVGDECLVEKYKDSFKLKSEHKSNYKIISEDTIDNGLYYNQNFELKNAHRKNGKKQYNLLSYIITETYKDDKVFINITNQKN